MHGSIKANQLKSALLLALVLTAGIQLIRVFLPSTAWYLRDSIRVESVTLALYVFVVMNVGFLAAILHKLLGGTIMLWLTAGGIALIRLIEQVVIAPAMDLWISVVGCGFLALFLPTFLTHIHANNDQQSGPLWTFGLILGLSIDSTIRGITGTLDLSWISGPFPILTIVLLSGGILYLVRIQDPSHGEVITDTGWRENLPLIGLGPYLVLQMIVFQNQGWVSEISGLPSQGGLIVLMLGNLLAMLGVSWGYEHPYTLRPIFSIAGTLFLIMISFGLDQTGMTFVIVLLFAQWLFGVCWAHMGKISFPASKKGWGRTTIFSTLGLLLFILLTFIYFTSLDIPIPFSRRVILPIVGTLFGVTYLGSVFGQRIEITPKKITKWAILTTAPLLLLTMIIAVVTPSTFTTFEPGTKPIKVMTYNIHSAYNIEGRQDPEAIAQVIEDNRADIVAIQEISRGWLVNGSTDLVSWLSQRLGMQALFKGTTGPMWGNAILSRYPILSHTYGSLPALETRLERGYLWARIDIGRGQPLNIINTHFHHGESDDLVRHAQAEALVQAWAGAPQTILLGDLNALPDESALKPIREAGFIDSWSEAGQGDGLTFSSSDPFKRIDWIWHTPDLIARDMTVPQTTASDHLPIVGIYETSQ